MLTESLTAGPELENDQDPKEILDLADHAAEKGGR
jgi:hypothetical protein